MGFRYAIIGAGMQGTAAAYDLARFGDADDLRLLDIDIHRARAAAERVNRLTERNVAKAGIVNATDRSSASQVLEGMHACLSAVPYYLNPNLARAALDARVSYADFGGNTEAAREVLALDREARAAGVSLIPDCGLAPGLSNVLAVYGVRSVEDAKEVHVRCGALPRNRDLPLGYKQLFALEGLTDRYFGRAIVLRNGRVTEVDTFSELETFELPAPIGRVEAVITAGGTSTCPYSFEGVLDSFDYKTIRYPGHFAAMKTFQELGFLSSDVIEVAGHPVRPRELFHNLMKKAWTHPNEPDLMVLVVDVLGRREGKAVRHRSLVVDESDPRTGFSAIERTSGFAAAIVSAMQARGGLAAGALPVERAVEPEDLVRELSRRGVSLETSISTVTNGA